MKAAGACWLAGTACVGGISGGISKGAGAAAIAAAGSSAGDGAGAVSAGSAGGAGSAAGLEGCSAARGAASASALVAEVSFAGTLRRGCSEGSGIAMGKSVAEISSMLFRHCLCLRLGLSSRKDMSETISGEAGMEPHNLRPQFDSHSLLPQGESPMVTAHPRVASSEAFVSKSSFMNWRLSRDLTESPRATTRTPAALASNFSEVLLGVIRPASMIKAIPFSATVRRSFAHSPKVSTIPLLPMGFAGLGITCRLENRMSWL